LKRLSSFGQLAIPLTQITSSQAPKSQRHYSAVAVGREKTLRMIGGLEAPHHPLF